MNSEDWEFLINVSKRVYGEHDGRNSYKYNNKDKEWINYVEKYANDKNNEKQENNKQSNKKQSNDNDLSNGIITIFIFFGVIFCIIYTLTCYLMSI